ncbi:MAG: hypothetical protein ABF296_07325 [Oceanococcaceae bacterium]
MAERLSAAGADWKQMPPVAACASLCVIVRAAPDDAAELRFSDWHPGYEALHTALRDYPWRVDWAAAPPTDE